MNLCQSELLRAVAAGADLRLEIGEAPPDSVRDAALPLCVFVDLRHLRSRELSFRRLVHTRRTTFLTVARFDTVLEWWQILERANRLEESA